MSVKLNFNINDYYENGQIKKKDVLNLKDYLKTQNLPHECEELIGISLMLCRGNVEVTKKFVSSQYIFKRNVPEAFFNRLENIEEMKKSWDVIRLLITPQMDDGTVVILMGLKESKSMFQYHDAIALKLLCMTFEACWFDQPITGYRVIMDLKNLNLLFLTRISISLLRRLMKYSGEDMKQYVRVVHFVNGGCVMNKLYKILEMIAGRDVMNLFVCHDKNMDWDEFYVNHISKEYLPSDYGGDLETSDKLQEQLWNKLESMSEFFKQEEKSRVFFSGLDDA